MRAISFITTVFLMAANLACMEKQAPRTAVPIVPQPARAPAPPPPVIADQTVVQLPAPQPVPPGSVPPRPAVEYRVPEEPAPVVVTPAPVRRATKPAAPAAPKESPAKENAPPAQAAGAEAAGAQPPGAQTPTEETPAAPAKPLRSAEDLATSSGQVNGILEDVKKVLSQVEAQQPKTDTTTASINRINSLVRLAEQASASNDLRQAESLAKRALALARDLNRP
jgi:hypothetical protein